METSIFYYKRKVTWTYLANEKKEHESWIYYFWTQDEYPPNFWGTLIDKKLFSFQICTFSVLFYINKSDFIFKVKVHVHRCTHLIPYIGGKKITGGWYNCMDT